MALKSTLGFGMMRLPVKNGDPTDFDYEQLNEMVDTYLAAGYNYFDTSYVYHNGKSEEFTGRALKAYPRESYFLATKLPMSSIDSLDKAKTVFEEQFARLGVEHVDFYLLHCLTKENWRKTLEFGIIDFLKEQQEKGRIRFLGFSFHDDYDCFEQIVTYRDWDFCQIQFNYMDIDEQAGMKGYELCVSRNIPVIVMEPVKGGSLATLADDVAAPFKAARPEKSVASWAMRWVGSLDHCKVILSGMSTEEQVEDNLSTFADFEPLSASEQEVVAKVRDTIRARTFVSCTKCKYCMPCPFGVDIPRNFAMMNRYMMYNNQGDMNWTWKDMGAEKNAAACKNCGKCEAVCPQHISIREQLAKIAAHMANC